MYPSKEQMKDDKFQSRKSDSFASIDVPVAQPNVLDYNGRVEKLNHCQQNPACIAQFSCSERPFDYGTSCESVLVTHGLINLEWYHMPTTYCTFTSNINLLMYSASYYFKPLLVW